jgi:ATP-dependent DNA helicase RecG
MKLAALQALIAAGESLTLELKKSTAEKDRACRSLCAMANGQGGRVVIGVTPAGKVVGQKVTDRTLEELAQEFQGFEPPLFPQLQRIPVPVAGKIVPGQMARIDTPDTPALPVEAVREALANAFIHRDYAGAAGSVSVALYDDRLEIISPGELHFGLTPEKLYLPHESKPWNPWIAKVFYRRGLIETWGRGTLKIASLMQEAGLAAPTLRVKDEFVTMTFELPVSLARSKKGSAPEETPGKTPGKTPNLILDWLTQAPGTSIPELAQHLGKSDSAIERAIRKLRADGKLVRIGPAKGGHWEVRQ